MSGEKAIDELRHTTKASELACLRRAHELNCINKDDYFRIYKNYKSQFEITPTSTSTQSTGSGSNYYTLKKSALGKLFVETVFEGVKSERLLYKDAYDLTDMKASSFEKFYKREGMLL